MPGYRPRSFERPPPRFYLPQLDGLRFLAFLLVFVHHGPKMSSVLMSGSASHTVFLFFEDWGWFGVDLFLVLSAYLITSLLLTEYAARGAISLRHFYLRRILRIWPLYYLVATIGFFVFPALQFEAPRFSSPEHVALLEQHLVPYYTLFGNFSVGVYGYPAVITLRHLWTVTLEEQFYIGWPLMLAVLMRRNRAALTWTILGCLLVSSIGLRFSLVDGRPHPFIWTNTFARLDPLVIGVALAMWRRAHPPADGWRAPLLKWLAGVALVSTIALAPPIQTQSVHVTWQFLATALGFGLILDAALPVRGNLLSTALAIRPLVWLGTLTYGLYVFHIIGLHLGDRLIDVVLEHWPLTPGAAVPLESALALAFTLVIAAFSYRAFESPFLRMKARFSVVPSRPVD